MYGGSAVAVAAIVQCEFEAPFEDPIFKYSTCQFCAIAPPESTPWLPSHFLYNGSAAGAHER